MDSTTLKLPFSAISWPLDGLRSIFVNEREARRPPGPPSELAPAVVVAPLDAALLDLLAHQPHRARNVAASVL